MNAVLVTKLEDAEKIVRNNYQLHWDGWNIIHTRPDPEAFRKPNGVFRNGQWCVKTTVTLKRAGWFIPRNFVC